MYFNGRPMIPREAGFKTPDDWITWSRVISFDATSTFLFVGFTDVNPHCPWVDGLWNKDPCTLPCVGFESSVDKDPCFWVVLSVAVTSVPLRDPVVIDGLRVVVKLFSTVPDARYWVDIPLVDDLHKMFFTDEEIVLVVVVNLPWLHKIKHESESQLFKNTPVCPFFSYFAEHSSGSVWTLWQFCFLTIFREILT